MIQIYKHLPKPLNITCPPQINLVDLNSTAFINKTKDGAKMSEKPKKKPKRHDPDKKTNEKIAELTDSLQRVQADFENFRKRAETEKQDFARYAKAETVLRLLPVLDNFELALKHTCSPKEFEEGVKLIFSQLKSELENMDVRRIDTQDKKFDPRYHEALMADFSDKPKDTIIEEFQVGYTLGDRVIRPSKVKISKGPKEDGDKKDNKDQ